MTFVQQKANLLATCPSEWVRDGKKAIELMSILIADRKEAAPGPYQILAAAYAEAGQFDEAIKAQEKAISLLGKVEAIGPKGEFGGTRDLKPQYEARLKLYQAKKPYRMEPPKAFAPPPAKGLPEVKN